MGDGNHYSRYIPCRMCGSMVMTTAPSTTCKECREIRERNRQKRRYRSHPDPDAYIVVNDPDELGGFHPGAVINREEMRQMLLECMASFTPGTVLRNREGQLFEITCNNRKFELVTI